MSRWTIVQCAWENTPALDAYLNEGWEPFAVTETDAVPTIWLRRSSERERIGIVRSEGSR